MVDTEENVRKYWAFISYSHADKAWADWLHRSLENYPMPRDLVGQPTPANAPIPKRFVPVFRDREELPTATDLGAVIARALRHARFLVVICSPRSAKSPWVEKEIIEYKRTHGESRVLCLIVDGEPWASGGKPGFSVDDECFPKAVRFQLGRDGELSDEPTEPIAADAREGKDGRENAVIKLMAGLLGVGFDDLRRREQEYQRRRLRRFQATAAVFGLLFIAAVSAAVYAVKQKRAALQTLSQSDLNLAVGARKDDDAARQVAYLARSLRSDPENPLAQMAAYSTLAHRKIHPPVGPALRHPSAVLAASGSADGKWILTSSGERVYLWSRLDHRLVAERSLADGMVNALAVHPSGNGWVAGTAKGRLHFIGLQDLKNQQEPLSQAFTVNRCVYLDETHVLLMSEGGLAQVRCLRSEEPAAEFLPFDPGYPDISSLSDDGMLLAAACSSDSLVRIYDLRTSKQLGRPLRFPSNLHGLCFSEDSQFLTAICWDGKVRRVDWRSALRFTVGEVEVVTPIDSGFDMLDELRFQPGGKLAALPTLDGIKIIDTIEGVVARTIPVQGGTNALAWSPDGKTIAAASRDQFLSFHPSDGSPGNSSIRISLAAPAIDLAWSPDARTLASLSSSNRVDCLSTDTGLPVGIGFPTGSSGMRLSWVSNGKWLAVSDGDERSKLWDPETGIDVVRLPDGGSGQLAPLDVPQRGAVLLTGEKGFYLVPVPLLKNTPDWLPSLLEGIGGGGHGSEDGRTMIDPDAWMTAEKIARAGTRGVLWSPVVDWLLDRTASRPAFPGALKTESEVTASIDMESTRVFDALVQRARVLLRSDDQNKHAEALILIEKALVIKPGHIQLLRTKQQIGQLTNRSTLVREACAAIASSTDSPLVDVLDAKFIEAGSQLSDEPKNPARARKLLEEILSVDPSREDAQNLLKATSP